MKRFTYLVPRSLDEAISMFESHQGRAKYIAGGTDILVKIKEGKEAPDYLISLMHILGQLGIAQNPPGQTNTRRLWSFINASNFASDNCPVVLNR